MAQENREVEPLITDNHTVHNVVHQEVLGFGGNPIVEKHMALHDALLEKGPPAQAVGQPMAGTQIQQPAGIPALQAGALPPTGQMPPGQQIQPEEAALARTMEEMGGGV